MAWELLCHECGTPVTRPVSTRSCIKRKAMGSPRTTFAMANPATTRVTSAGSSWLRRMKEMADDQALRATHIQNIGWHG